MTIRSLAFCALLFFPSSTMAQAPARDGAQTAALLRQLYASAGPDLGCQLLEPDAVLVMAGHIGLLENPYLRGDTGENAKKLEELNALLRPRGLVLKLKKSWLPGKMGLRIVSLAGVARTTHATHYKYIQPYDAASGWPGFKRWEDWEMNISSLDADRHAAIGHERDFLDTYYATLLGIPELAARPLGEPRVWAETPSSSRLECLYSQYQVRLADFLAARRRVLELAEPSADQGWWSDERGRLGLWTAIQWEEMRHLRARRLTVEHQRIFALHAAALCEGARRGATASSLIALCGSPIVESATLLEWARLGRTQQTGPEHDFFVAASEGKCAWLTPSGDSSSHFKQAEDAFQGGDFAGALLDYEASARLDPNNEKALVYAGDCLLRLDRLEEATQRFEQALKLQPGDALAYRFLGKALELRYNGSHDAGLLDRSLAACEKAYALDPSERGKIQLERVRRMKSAKALEKNN